MRDLHHDIWQTMGTSLIWDAAAIEEATRNGISISLRELLVWEHEFPVEPPGNASTIVVTGLQEVLEVSSTADSDLILDRVHRVVRKHSSTWGETGIVFAMQDGGGFDVRPPSGSIVLRLQSGRQVEIGSRLWRGAASDAQPISIDRMDARGRDQRVTIGYWLRRVS